MLLFALLVSRILDPLWVIPAVTILAAYKHGVLFTLALMVFMLGIPLVLRLFYKHGGCFYWSN